jgi:hypothetical protein
MSYIYDIKMVREKTMQSIGGPDNAPTREYVETSIMAAIESGKKNTD